MPGSHQHGTMPNPEFICPVCNKTYTGWKNWRVHCQKSHNGADPRVPAGELSVQEGLEKIANAEYKPVKLVCTWEGCDREFDNFSGLWSHCQNGHAKIAEIQTGSQEELSLMLGWDRLLINHAAFEEFLGEREND